MWLTVTDEPENVQSREKINEKSRGGGMIQEDNGKW